MSLLIVKLACEQISVMDSDEKNYLWGASIDLSSFAIVIITVINSKQYKLTDKANQTTYDNVSENY